MLHKAANVSQAPAERCAAYSFGLCLSYTIVNFQSEQYFSLTQISQQYFFTNQQLYEPLFVWLFFLVCAVVPERGGERRSRSCS